MTSQEIVTPPSVSWAQRSARVFLTFNVECEKPYIKIEKKLISFKGTCTPDNILHEVVIPLYADIDPDKSAYKNKGRLIEVVLTKDKTDAPFWPSLTSDKKKHHWLKVDFNRWQDEDESGEDTGDFDDLNDMFSSKMGDFGDDNMFSSKMGDFGDDNAKDDSSSAEEEDLPDIQ